MSKNIEVQVTVKYIMSGVISDNYNAEELRESVLNRVIANHCAIDETILIDYSVRDMKAGDQNGQD